MGRAARHIEGRVIMYADNITGSMKEALDEVTRRRKYQEEYNKKNKITPTAINKAVRDRLVEKEAEEIEVDGKEFKVEDIPEQDKGRIIGELERRMQQAVQNL